MNSNLFLTKVEYVLSSECGFTGSPRPQHREQAVSDMTKLVVYVTYLSRRRFFTRSMDTGAKSLTESPK